MPSEEYKRATTRLRIEKGIVLLRYGGVPSVACTLNDLSEGGCRCVVPMATLDEQTAQAWEKILAPSRTLNVEISSPPHLNHFPVDADVAHLSVVQGGGLEIGFKFLRVTDDQVKLLQLAMLSFATEKVRSAFTGGVEKGATKYLVGAGAEIREGMPPADGPEPTAAPEGAEPRAVKAGVQGSVTSAKVPPAPPARSPAKAKRFETAPPAPQPSPAEPVATPPMRAEQAPATPSEEDASAPPPQVAPEPEPQQGDAALEKPSDPFRGKKIGEVLVQMGKMTREQVEDLIQRAPLSGGRIGQYMVRERVITPQELCRALALQSGLPMVDLDSIEIQGHLGLIFPHDVMAQHEFVPFDESPDMVCIACADPIDERVALDLEGICHRNIEIFLGQEDIVEKLLRTWKPKAEKSKVDRKHLRYTVHLDCFFRYCNRLGQVVSETVFRARTIDISEGGFAIEGQSTSLGTPDDLRRRGLCLQVAICGDKDEVTALCGLRFVKIKSVDEPTDLPWVFGLQILEMSDAHRRRLKELCISVGKRQ